MWFSSAGNSALAAAIAATAAAATTTPVATTLTVTALLALLASRTLVGAALVRGVSGVGRVRGVGGLRRRSSVVLGVTLVGQHRSARPGEGNEFAAIRPYQSGDRMRDGALDPTGAFMGGRLAVEGDMGAAMRLASLLA